MGSEANTQHAFISLDSADMLWIGLNAQKTARYFEWSDDSHVTYTKWQSGEPTYLQDSMDNCVIMSREVKIMLFPYSNDKAVFFSTCLQKTHFHCGGFAEGIC